jgi:hypothetical protein
MEKLEKFGDQTPMGRAGQPAELGSIYLQFAAADASYVTARSTVQRAARANPEDRCQMSGSGLCLSRATKRVPLHSSIS